MSVEYLYEVVEASPFEVGLVRIDVKTGERTGVKTWWAREFSGKLPAIEHPTIQAAIRIDQIYRP